jgi:hypothetical protein
VIEGTTEGRAVALDGILENRVDGIQGGCHDVSSCIILEVSWSADEKAQDTVL